MTTLFRTDASLEIGTGHLMRCLALAQALRDDGMEVAFLSSSLPTSLKERLQQEECTVHELKSSPHGEDDSNETATVAKDINAQWIVVDGYKFDAAYQQTLKRYDSKVLFIDDYGHVLLRTEGSHDMEKLSDHSTPVLRRKPSGAWAKKYTANIVLNQNVYADEMLYAKRNPGTKLLLGPRYVLLRREFTSASKHSHILENVRMFGGGTNTPRILVTLGGADPQNATGKVIDAVKDTKGMAVKIVVGSTNPNLNAVKEACHKAHVEMIADATDMRGLMEWADLAIAGGGTTCYELARLGVPFLTIVLADNQCAVAEGIEKAGASINLGWHADLAPTAIGSTVQSLILDTQKRATMSQAGRSLVDGCGALRVTRAVTGDALWLRPANIADCKITFDWTNDPETRAVSFSPEQIEWDEHVKWFKEKLNSPTCIFFIGLNVEDQPVGQVRFDCENSTATISVSIDPARRGKGYGKALITQGCRRLFATRTAKNIDAYIKPENEASHAAFQKAGFREVGPTEIKGQSAVHYTLKSSSM